MSRKPTMQETTASHLPDEIRAPLREVLARFPEIGLAVLFGSVAAGTARADSDLDLAVAGPKPLTVPEKIALIQAFADKTGRPIDLIYLHTVAEPVLGQIVRHGQRVQGSSAAFAHWVNRHLIEQADFMPYRNRILAERRMAWIGK